MIQLERGRSPTSQRSGTAPHRRGIASQRSGTTPHRRGIAAQRHIAAALPAGDVAGRAIAAQRHIPASRREPAPS
jgi:hypothetical protein